MTAPLLAITMGDPAGIGPEICLDLLDHGSATGDYRPIVFGDAHVLSAVADRLNKPRPRHIISQQDWSAEYRSIDAPAVLDVADHRVPNLEPGKIDGDTGQASFRYVICAIEAALAGEVAGVTTGPINKEALFQGGIRYPGHTEIFAEKAKAERSCMMLTSDEITCAFATTHVGYSSVPGLLSIERISDVIELAADAMRLLREREPKLVVCGLNPHAGEHGLFGDREEERIIVPAIEQARQNGIDIEGPLPPDTAFLKWRRESTDAFICMYHDQGHIPLKALAFDKAINITLGLPMIRTSVDHGTALDIAWQGKADSSSLFLAAELAGKLARGRETVVAES
ncbi:4-hydroxythreonine-4-phosphate dehydrogenase PdxA [Stratiformator vulcanicus]|uniref:4-hydroxythreonine-4-phosphate dehydrogenase n=1 Tax=Stratiformator vulcanicus TaxID=2527980 RepID=A0A517R1E4_9PLAN|nr:4-hydroxythreonine-4-phosphate dehydrogenase PdxA [Stratiformator vulcanicus]QDT37706.1 4-hydroxythreonine-4-phosphate dehydrogenase [Stratiformator vulcanicus]